MDIDILYKNAIYFKENILPKTFVLKTKSGDIIIKPTEKDFAHLVGVQHSKNDNILITKPSLILNKALTKEIDIIDLMQNIDINHLTQKQKYIYNKNVAFIPLFKDFVKKVNIRKYKKDFYLNSLDSFHCDYHHNRIAHKDAGGRIDDLEVLAIIKQKNKSHFLFNSILKTTNPEEIKKYIFFKPVGVYDVLILDNKDWDDYLKENDKYIKENKSTQNSKKNQELSNKDISDINMLLKNNLAIKKGMYGKKSIQIYFKDKLIEKNANINLKSYDTARKIAEYVNDTYGKNR